jgi:predicted amidohydrolase
MKVAAIQHDIAWEQPADNHARLAGRIASAAADGAGLVVLAEMFPTGFSMATERVAQPVDGPSTQFLVEQARATGAWVCGSIPTQGDALDPRATNRFVLAGPQGERHHYDKLHPFTFAGEHERYRPGDATRTVEVNGVRVTPFVCYDLRFADDFWAEAAGTDLYVVVANWPAARRAHWQTLLRARAIENQAYVLGVNRVGTGDGIDYAGDSAIVDPFGVELAVADAGAEQIISAEIDPARVAEVRATYPFLRDRRTYPSAEDRPSG